MTYQNNNLRTLDFILHNNWECPLCRTQTPIKWTKCQSCHREMGITGPRFEYRLKRVCPPGVYDHETPSKK